MDHGSVAMRSGTGNDWQQFRSQGVPVQKTVVFRTVLTGRWEWNAGRDHEESRTDVP